MKCQGAWRVGGTRLGVKGATNLLDDVDEDLLAAAIGAAGRQHALGDGGGGRADAQAQQALAWAARHRNGLVQHKAAEGLWGWVEVGAGGRRRTTAGLGCRGHAACPMNPAPHLCSCTAGSRSRWLRPKARRRAQSWRGRLPAQRASQRLPARTVAVWRDELETRSPAGQVTSDSTPQ